MSADSARRLYRRQFGTEPVAIASAPGRVNVIGDHTDYNGGEVLPIAISRRTWVAVGPDVTERGSMAVSARQDRIGMFDVGNPRPAGGWWDYIAGMARELVSRGIALPQLEIAVWSDVPVAAGLSSSAALEMASGLALLALVREELPARELALLGHRVEGEFIGVATGIMDQFASALGREGHALHLWCDTGAVEQVPFPASILVFDTRVPRALRDSAFNRRRRECEEALALLRRIYPTLPNLAAVTLDQLLDARLPEPLTRRVRHVASETARVREFVESLRHRGTVRGDLLYASHESLRGDYECSTPELDWFVMHVMRCDGIQGARLTGAGWGGCAIAVGDEEALEEAAPVLVRDYERNFARAPAAWITRAGAGAHVDVDDESA